MIEKFVIKWKSNVNGRVGRGSRQFMREEAERLVAELNDEYPDILHEMVPAPEMEPEASPAVVADPQSQVLPDAPPPNEGPQENAATGSFSSFPV